MFIIYIILIFTLHHPHFPAIKNKKGISDLKFHFHRVTLLIHMGKLAIACCKFTKAVCHV